MAELHSVLVKAKIFLSFGLNMNNSFGLKFECIYIYIYMDKIKNLTPLLIAIPNNSTQFA
jgi:hypothetical protein